MKIVQSDWRPESPYRSIGESLDWAGRKLLLLKSSDFAQTGLRPSFIARFILSMPGAFLRLLATLDKPIFQISRIAAAAPEKQEISLLTLNTACLPSWITTRFNELRPTEIRAQEIADAIMQQDFDVVCLQELFSEESYRIISSKLKERYGWSVHHAGQPYIGFHSGLCIFSKFPIGAADFQKYTHLAGEDRFTNKGFLSCDLQVGSRSVRVYTTHTQAGGYPKALKRRHLLERVHVRRRPHFEAFATHIEKAKNDAVIVAGDFNLNLLNARICRRNGERFFALFKAFVPQGTGTVLTRKYLQEHQQGKHNLAPSEPLPVVARVIDGIFVTKNSKASAEDVTILDTFTNSSDHLAMSSKVILE